MSQQACDQCGELFKHEELVEAHVIAHFQLLKANRIFAIDKPQDCLCMIHYPRCPNV